MANAKVVSLNARPWKVSQLCFEVGGILEQFPAQLGDTVTPFDFTAFYAGLSATVGGDPSLLEFNSQGILSAPGVAASLLATLRAEPRKAALDKAVNGRQNAFFSKYGNSAAIVTVASTLYGPGATAKPQRLQNLANLAQQQADQLDAAYNTDGRTGVVRNTNSSLNALTVTTDSSSSTGQSTSITEASGESNQQTIGGSEFPKAILDALPPAGGSLVGVEIDQTSGPDAVSESFQEGTTGLTSTATQDGQQTSTGKAYAVETETIVNTDYGYRVPSIENQAQNERAQISLIDQQFAQFMAGQNLPNLAQVFQNELKSIDLSVYQLQVGFLNTLLLSPIVGTVTGIYKNPGDPVRAGEPVVRVEDNATLMLLARVIFRGQILTNSTNVTVKTNLFDAGGPQTVLKGTVIAARGGGEDDLWDLVVQCKNPVDGAGNPIVPIGYRFDYDPNVTTVSIP